MIQGFNSFDFVKEISDFLTEPFRQQRAAAGAPSGVNSALPPPPNNAMENMGRSLDALSLNSGPSTGPSNPSVDPSFPHLRDKAWFYGAITRAECDNLLNQYGQDGDFLVRSSETNVSFYFVYQHQS